MVTKRSIRVAIVDPHNAFAHNISVACINLGASVAEVFTRKRIHTCTIEKMHPTHIVLGPTDGDPNLPIFNRVLTRFKCQIPILGITSGMLAMGIHLGLKVVKCGFPMQGKVAQATHADWSRIFEGIPSQFNVCCYRHLDFIPQGSSVRHPPRFSARGDRGETMGIEWPDFPNLVGLGFQAESLFTEHGNQVLKNFLAFE